MVPTLNSGGRVWLKQLDEDTVELRPRIAGDAGRAQIDAYSIMLLIDSVRLATGPEWRPQTAALDSAAGRLANRHEALSEAVIDGKVDYVAFSFPKSFLGFPLRPNRGEHAGAEQAELELIATAPASDLSGSVIQAVRSTLSLGAPTIEVAADLARMSVRTLQRRLSENAFSYGEVVDRVRFDDSVAMLEDPRTKLSEIARRLGYGDSANFTRAFRRWTGMTPSKFRRVRPEFE